MNFIKSQRFKNNLYFNCFCYNFKSKFEEQHSTLSECNVKKNMKISISITHRSQKSKLWSLIKKLLKKLLKINKCYNAILS